MNKKNNIYTTDGKVKIYSTSEENINIKLGKIIGEKFINYRKKWDLANKMELVTDFPLFLHLDMNQKCNYRCPHCIIGTPSEVSKYYDGDDLSFKDYKKIIDEGADYECPSVEPQGNNEPFLTKNLHEYILYAHKKGFIDIMLNNNGSAFTKKRAEQILDSGLTRLRFSLDAATPETYSKVRVGSIPLDKVIKNIEYFLELRAKKNYKLPIVGVSFCQMSSNEHELDQFINFWKNKVDIIAIQRFVPPVPNENGVAPEKYKKFYSSEQLIEEPIKEFKCVQPFQRVMIKNDKIGPCCVSFNKELILGSIHETTIHKAWHSDKMNDIREMHKKGEFIKNKTCNDCVNLIYPTNQITEQKSLQNKYSNQ
jgi:radical SAM protein with 4Fe4S-binding SPASM domain